MKPGRFKVEAVPVHGVVRATGQYVSCELGLAAFRHRSIGW